MTQNHSPWHLHNILTERKVCVAPFCSAQTAFAQREHQQTLTCFACATTTSDYLLSAWHPSCAVVRIANGTAACQ